MVYLFDSRSSGEHRQDSNADSIDRLPYRLVEHHLLSTDTGGNADDIRTDTMGILAIAEMGKQLGEVADKVSDRAFLWSDALLRRILRAASFRHCALHTGGEPDGNYRQ